MMQQSTAALTNLADQEFDVVVIGGGIVGSGIARDAAMRGLRVGLVDQYDFAFGTSSRSSRLIHGGLRYLAQGRVRLVREASLEKTILHRIAPHLSQPLPLVFPSYRGQGWPLWQLSIGVKLYDLLCSGRNLGPSTILSKAESLAAVPGLQPENLSGAARYFDGLTNDSRLVIDTLRSATRHGATVANYIKFKDAQKEGGRWLCTLQPRGDFPAFTIEARTLVNAAGPWSEQIPHSQVRLRLSKGTHLVFARSRIPATDAVVITEGKRILFVIPWGQRVIVGTTDTDFAGQPEDVAVDAADIDYILGTVNGFFPSRKLKRADIVSSWAGVRPLIANRDGSPSDISRTHQINEAEPGWWDVSGGKLTTYRLMAEQTVDRVCRHLHRRGLRSRTAVVPLLEAGAAVYSGIVPPEPSRDAAAHFVRNEWAQTLDDVMLRRTSWQHYCAQPEKVAADVAQWMAEEAGWTEQERDRQLGRYINSVDPLRASAAAA